MTLQSFTLVLHPKSMRVHQKKLFLFQYLTQLATSDKQVYTPCSPRNGSRHMAEESRGIRRSHFRYAEPGTYQAMLL